MNVVGALVANKQTFHAQSSYLLGKNIQFFEVNGAVVPKGHLHESDPKIHTGGCVQWASVWVFNSEPG